jgi:hypothetical protein
MSRGAQDVIDRAADDLSAAARRYRASRHRRVRRVMQASFVLVVASIVAIVVSQRGAQAGPVQITVSHGIVQIAVLDPTAPAEQVEKLLTDARVPYSVESVPTGPTHVDRVVGLVGGSAGDQGPLSITLAVGSPFTLEVGRPAAPGESYSSATDPFAPGEPLACLGGKGADAAALAARVPAGVTVEWRDSRTGKPVGVSALDGRRVDIAITRSATAVLIYAAEGKGHKRQD